jgi:large subunit ribosomal protein L25
MSSHDLKVSTRDTVGKEAAKRMRREGMVPAVAYGHKEEPVKLALNAKELRDLLAHGGGRGLLNLKYEGRADESVIIKSLQRHPRTHAVSSVDFPARVAQRESDIDSADCSRRRAGQRSYRRRRAGAGVAKP